MAAGIWRRWSNGFAGSGELPYLRRLDFRIMEMQKIAGQGHLANARCFRCRRHMTEIEEIATISQHRQAGLIGCGYIEILTIVTHPQLLLANSALSFGTLIRCA